ncbi:ATP-binding cassette sub-family D member 3-like [Dysidea avara]|uniref:ATP-binding cassette sub-family D member 3-like n=1 Tax=Dysidea avara TaxID=196820 RepID=UPI003325F89C
MPSVLSKVTDPRAISAVIAGALVVYYYSKGQGRKSSSTGIVYSSGTQQNSKQPKASVDLRFFRQIWRILKIVLPGLITPEVGYMLLVAVALLGRTYCDLWMIKNNTATEAAIIGRNSGKFLYHLKQLFMAMPMISLITNLLKFGLGELKLRFRIRLTRALYDKYMSRVVYYQMTNLDNRMQNPDQVLTQDVDKLCDSLVELYSNLSKPLLDICLYSTWLAGSIGPQGPLSMLLYLLLSGVVLTRLRSPVGKMTAKEQRLEGELRYVSSRITTNGEEIAFYQGGVRERLTVFQTLSRLASHLRNSVQFRFSVGMLDSIIAKYFATVVGFVVLCQPFLDLSHPRFLNATQNEILLDYYRNGRMLIRLAEAVGRVVLAGRELTRLSGYTARITELLVVLADLDKGVYQRTMVAPDQKETDGEVSQPSVPLIPGSGEIVEQDRLIKFEHVPLVTPNGDVLVKGLSFEVQAGMNVLVCGPNGCGKSSLFRILGELWPLFGGRLTKPHKSKLFYVPQRPYMTIGTLRDQVIYPDSIQEQQRKHISDHALRQYLDQVQLSYLLERENGWDAVQDWMDVLSGGEKQRMAMARLFYHQPQYAILDECTSAVSVDVEGFIYSHCREKEIALFTVSHRKSLWKHHEYVLQFDGRGSYQFKKIDPSEEEFGS